MPDELDYGELMHLVCEHYGISSPGWGKVHCPDPDHDDSRPSCSLDMSKGVWRCHGCGAGGGVYHLISTIEGMDLGLARQRAAEIAGGRLPPVSGAAGGGRGDLPSWARSQSPGGRTHLPDWARR
ncbi:hypothetical protein GCM10009550_01480 [Actinocorallia libanotica]|uniref:Zinc finger CHC2-type domain-containing protein n=1 Tax=Actinocorallia libanotica TaxID=46162 RepID=A0ABN1Q1E1_9ACTN